MSNLASPEASLLFSAEVCREVLLRCDQLVEAGQSTNDVGLNKFGEMAMQIDVQSEKLVIEALREAGIGARIISEEHSTLDIGESLDYTVFLDGFDGSSVFRESAGKSRGGLMFSVYKGANPTFRDYVCAGVTDLSEKAAVVAARGLGAIKITEKNHSFERVNTSQYTDIEDGSLIYIDEGVNNYADFPATSKPYFYEPVKKKYKTKYLGSSAVYLYDLALGRALAVLEYGRKANLEHMVAYPVVVEAGGEMELMDGGPLSEMAYEEYCNINQGYPAVLLTANDKIESNIRADLH